MHIAVLSVAGVHRAFSKRFGFSKAAFNWVTCCHSSKLERRIHWDSRTRRPPKLPTIRTFATGCKAEIETIPHQSSRAPINFCDF